MKILREFRSGNGLKIQMVQDASGAKYILVNNQHDPEMDKLLYGEPYEQYTEAQWKEWEREVEDSVESWWRFNGRLV